MSLFKYNETYKPFKHEWAMKLAETHEVMHWHELEADLQDDIGQWKTGKLSSWEINHVTQILRLFTQTDVQVGQNYCDLFIPTFKNNEVRNMLLSFAAREGIHQRAYALLNETLGLPESEYSAFLEYEEMADKIEFMKKNDVATEKGMGLALAQSACNEGMSLFSAFIQLLNYQRQGKMRGMCEIVLWSIRDESEHCKGMTRLFREFCKEKPQVVTDEFKLNIYDMFRDAVSLEDKFIDLSYSMGEPDSLPKETVKQYIRYIADRRLTQLGLKPNWGVDQNPCDWFDWLVAGESHGNFFEGRVTDYSGEGLLGEEWGYKDLTD